MINNADAILFGGRILCLATALRILEARPNMRLECIEKESSLAQHQKGHNSGVIHSRLNYRPGSLKANNCSTGYEQMLTFYRKEVVLHEICGKIVVFGASLDLSSA